ncbi:MAG: hypothetical protein ABIF10_04295 [Candidatus Woesearchaeota archaeon]
MHPHSNIAALVLDSDIAGTLGNMSEKIINLYPQISKEIPTKQATWIIRTRQGEQYFDTNALPAGFCSIYEKNGKPKAIFSGIDEICKAEEAAEALTGILEPKKHFLMPVPKRLNAHNGHRLGTVAFFPSCYTVAGVIAYDLFYNHIHLLKQGLPSKMKIIPYLDPWANYGVAATENLLGISRSDATVALGIGGTIAAIIAGILIFQGTGHYLGKLADSFRNKKIPAHAINYNYGRDAVEAIYLDYGELSRQRMKQELWKGLRPGVSKEVASRVMDRLPPIT